MLGLKAYLGFKYVSSAERFDTSGSLDGLVGNIYTFRVDCEGLQFRGQELRVLTRTNGLITGVYNGFSASKVVGVSVAVGWRAAMAAIEVAAGRPMGLKVVELAMFDPVSLGNSRNAASAMSHWYFELEDLYGHIRFAFVDSSSGYVSYLSPEKDSFAVPSLSTRTRRHHQRWARTFRATGQRYSLTKLPSSVRRRRLVPLRRRLKATAKPSNRQSRISATPTTW